MARLSNAVDDASVCGVTQPGVAAVGLVDAGIVEAQRAGIVVGGGEVLGAVHHPAGAGAPCLHGETSSRTATRVATGPSGVRAAKRTESGREA